MFMRDSFVETASAISRFTHHKHPSPLMMHTVLVLVPVLAEYDAQTLVEHYLATSMDQLVAHLAVPADRNVAFGAIGLLAHAVGSENARSSPRTAYPLFRAIPHVALIPGDAFPRLSSLRVWRMRRATTNRPPPHPAPRASRLARRARLRVRLRVQSWCGIAPFGSLLYADATIAAALFPSLLDAVVDKHYSPATVQPRPSNRAVQLTRSSPSAAFSDSCPKGRQRLLAGGVCAGKRTPWRARLLPALEGQVWRAGEQTATYGIKRQ
ncbi:hypothetical protein AURDEDRAFT_169309 [Auricularia subglabra TFB-10046 SS5]|nr:hypothetical protein AURDEDRAFT_169309 [Auricularia subglabra TFB-10046 SS5]